MGNWKLGITWYLPFVLHSAVASLVVPFLVDHYENFFHFMQLRFKLGILETSQNLI